MTHGREPEKIVVDDLEKAGYKDLGREGVKLGRLALDEAKLTSLRQEEIKKLLVETNRLLGELLDRLAPKPKETDALG